MTNYSEAGGGEYWIGITASGYERAEGNVAKEDLRKIGVFDDLAYAKTVEDVENVKYEGELVQIFHPNVVIEPYTALETRMEGSETEIPKAFENLFDTWEGLLGLNLDVQERCELKERATVLYATTEADLEYAENYIILKELLQHTPFQESVDWF